MLAVARVAIGSRKQLHVAGIAVGMFAEGSCGKLAVRALGALTLVGGVACIGGLA